MLRTLSVQKDSAWKERAKEASILIGATSIAKYMGCSRQTIYRWRTHRSFPAAKLPNGRLAITRNQIEQWLLARYMEQMNGRQHRPR